MSKMWSDEKPCEHLRRPTSCRRGRNGRLTAENSRRLFFEPLEERRLLAVLTVNSLADNVTPGDGFVTLREAILAANSDSATDLGDIGSGADVIQFADELSGAVHLTVADNLAADNHLYGPSALVITSPISIVGNSSGITIGHGIVPNEMRLFRVASDGDLTLQSLTLTGGKAQGGVGETGRGGALFVTSAGQLSIVDSTFTNNTARGGTAAAGRGGAIYNDAGDVSISNSTFSGNWVRNSEGNVSGFGAGIYNRNGTLSIYSSTFAESILVPGRGVYVIGDGPAATATLHMYNSIVAGQGNSTDVVVTEDAGGIHFAYGSHNIIGDAATVAYNETNAVKADPMLGELADNGGPTWTHALLPGSPAIDAGDPAAAAGMDHVPLFDQRGAPHGRIRDGDDVAGAVLDLGSLEMPGIVAPPELPGDYNGDRTVNAADYTVWRNSLGMNVPMYSGADGNGSGVIDAGDYVTWRTHYGQSLPEGSGAANMVSTMTAAPAAWPQESTTLPNQLPTAAEFAAALPPLVPPASTSVVKVASHPPSSAIHPHERLQPDTWQLQLAASARDRETAAGATSGEELVRDCAPVVLRASDLDLATWWDLLWSNWSNAGPV